jgi:hypothetical protein
MGLGTIIEALRLRSAAQEYVVRNTIEGFAMTRLE